MLLDDRWQVDESTGRSGGQATVYKGQDLRDGGVVAIKMLHRKVWDDGASQGAFNRELEALYRLSHPNIIRVLDHGRTLDSERPYIVLEWMDNDLATEIERYGAYKTWDSFSEIGVPALQALAYAHSQNQLHRDLKPENILLDPDTAPRIADFGISKIVDTVLSSNVTFEWHGTKPYLPPEMEQNPTSRALHRDVYAFAVLSLEAIAGVRFRTRDDVLKHIDTCDSESEAAEFIHSALHEDPAQRPQCAADALLLVEPAFRKWKRKVDDGRRRSFSVSLGVTNRAAEVVADRLGIQVEPARQTVIDDLNDCGRLVSEQGSAGRDDSLLAATQTFRYRLVLDERVKGSLVVVDATALPISVLQNIRDRAWDEGQATFHLQTQSQTAPGAKTQDGVDLFTSVVSFCQARQAKDKFDEKKRMFEGWRRLLKAKKTFEEDRGAPVRFKNRAVLGKRVAFEVRQNTNEELVGQPRYVVVEGGLRVRGEVTAVGENKVELTIERGDPSDIPSSGELVFDADAALHALRVQEEAIERVAQCKSACPQLAEIVAYPEKAMRPHPIELEDFVQPALDSAKKDCVRLALGSDQVMVVEGPPGTGKTTFIAEVVFQYLRRNPSARVLLASQTHVALDNALNRIREWRPEMRLLRLGAPDKISPNVQDLSVDVQKRKWRHRALAQGRRYLAKLAEDGGLDPAALEISHLARSLRLADAALFETRGLLVRERAEMRLDKEQLAEMDLLLDLGLEPDTSPAEETAGPATPTTNLQRRSVLEQEIAAYEESIASLAAQVDERKIDFDARRTELAALLDLPPDTSAEVILEHAESYEVEDPALRRLYELHLEWEKICGIKDEFVAGLVAEAEVVAGTCIGIGGSAARSMYFDLCIVDEASKATSTEALVPMSMARTNILVGDRKQLPPFNEEVLYNPDLVRRFKLDQSELCETVFERLGERLVEGRKALTHQHRMLPEIGSLISDCFYDRMLTSEPKARDNKLELILPAAVIWYTTSGLASRRETTHGTSYANELESRLVMHLLERISNFCKIANKKYEVAVLTGYWAQRESIDRRVRAASAELAHVDVMVNSVDAFQGQEADICIFSMTRSNDKGALGFLKSDRRINVALSRGKQALIIVGDSDFTTATSESPNPMLDVLDYIDGSPECLLEDGGDLL